VRRFLPSPSEMIATAPIDHGDETGPVEQVEQRRANQFC
jgi:hypothetical protein